MKMKEEELASANVKLADIKSKNAKAEKLLDIWSNSVEQRNIIEKYIPEQKQEEDIISSLTSLVSDNKVALTVLSISSSEEKDMPSIGENSVINEKVNNIDVADQLPKTGSVNVVLGVVGDYGKIKTLLSKIESLKRFNNISSLKIAKASDEGNGTILQADMSLNFDYIPKTKSAINPNNKIFLTGVFDMGIAEEIMQKLSTDIKTTVVGSAGRENPFVK